MYAKYKFSLKCVLTLVVLLFTIQCASSDDDDGEDATVEVEQTDSIADVPYTSPTPSGKQ